MKWTTRFVFYLAGVVLIQIVLPNAAKQIDESIPFISTGNQHVLVTRCSEPLSIFVGDNVTFYCNASVALVCDADGEPAPSIAWLFNGKSVGKELGKKSLLRENDSLVLRNVSQRVGVYTCVASNVNGTSNASTVVKHIDPRPPKIRSDFKTEVFTANYKILPMAVGGNVTAYGKSLVMLVCNVTGLPRPQVEWSRSGGKIERKYVKENSLLLPHNVALSGKYVCKATNFAGETQLASSIQFKEPVQPRILSSRQKLVAINGENQVTFKVGVDVTTIAGTEVTIKCLVSGAPEPEVTWYHNGRICPKSHLGLFGYGLAFHNKAIQPNEGGNYTCVASHAFGRVSVTSHIDVIEPVMPYINSSSEDVISYDMSLPTVKQIGGSLKLLVGASFWIECNVGGIPQPQVAWKKDNLRIHSSKRIKVAERKIEVLGAMMSDTGWYSCRAASGAGTATRATFVHLIAPEKPHIARYRYRRRWLVNNMPTPLGVNIGIDLRILAYRELTIYCSATGFPPPVLSWQKNGYPIGVDENVFVSQGGGKLVFRRLLPSQNGAYSCVASNAAGQDRQRTMILSRLPLRPKIELRKSVLSKYQLSPPNFRGFEIPEKEETRLIPGSDVILECIAKRGYPGSKFKWFKDGIRLRRKIDDTFNQSKLKLTSVQKRDEGVYKCFASNIIGQQEKIIEIRLKERNQYNV